MMNVLVVDDMRMMRALSKTLLTDMGHHVLEAENGRQAIDMCEREKIDMILLDVEMPGLNGFETAKAIRATNVDWFPIVFLSARTEPEFFVEGIRSGGDAYLYKPIVPEVLESMIKAMERIFNAQEELHQARVQLERIAHRDPMTGLINRRGYDNAIDLEFNKAVHDKSGLAVAMIDVDYFKPYNDNYGHQQGDECLRQLGKILDESATREADIVARYGGEEFCMVLPKTTAEQAQLVVQRVLDKLAERKLPHDFSPFKMVTVSCGIAQLSSEHENYQQLIKDADRRLYGAKAQGRNSIKLDDN